MHRSVDNVEGHVEMKVYIIVDENPANESDGFANASGGDPKVINHLGWGIFFSWRRSHN